MKELNKFPKATRESIKKVARALKTDYKSAYFAILLESIMSDLNPSDPAIPEIILNVDQG